VIFWLAIELIFRFFMQSLPVMNIKPLLVLPIKKSQSFCVDEECHFYLQYFPLIDDYPFGIFNIVKKLWDIKHYYLMLGMYLLALIVNYANFLIKKFAENIIAFLPFAMDWCFWLGLLWSFKITTFRCCS
jgi:hypothetical protein